MIKPPAETGTSQSWRRYVVELWKRGPAGWWACVSREHGR